MSAIPSGAVVVTGANGGIGSALVSYLVEAGYRDVACQFRSSSSNIAGVLKGRGLDPTRHLFQAELTDEQQVGELRQAVADRFGSISTLINVAGGSTNAMSWKMEKSDFSAVVDTNLTSTFLCCREFIPEMRGAGYGRIVNVSSVVSTSGAVGASHYAAAKGGINSFTKSVALELATKGVTVNAIALGYFDAGIIDTIPDPQKARIIETIPMARLGRSGDEVGPLVEYLISPGAAYMTGQTLHLSGGLF